MESVDNILSFSRLKKRSDECQCEKIVNCAVYKKIEIPNFRDEEYLKLVKTVFKNLREVVSVPQLSSDTINIALHYREGGDVDDSAAKAKFPKKFMGLSYYLTGLRDLLLVIPEHCKVLVGVFSDSNDTDFVNDVRSEAGKTGRRNIEVKYLTKLDQPALRDFIYMSKFDFIVRSNSHFAKCSEILGDFVGSVCLSTTPSSGKKHCLRIHNFKFKSLLNRVE